MDTTWIIRAANINTAMTSKPLRARENEFDYDFWSMNLFDAERSINFTFFWRYGEHYDENNMYVLKCDRDFLLTGTWQNKLGFSIPS